MAPRRRRRLTVLAVSGPSGAGKTRLLARLIPALARRGLRVGALKHSGHAHALDRPGADSARLKLAGALAVAVQGPVEMALFGPPLRGGARALARRLPPVDLVLAEGFRREPLPRLEVHRRAVSRAFLCSRDARVLAVVGDEDPPRGLPLFRPSQIEALAQFLVERLRLGPGRVRKAGRGRRPPGRRRGRSSGRPGPAARRSRAPGESPSGKTDVYPSS